MTMGSRLIKGSLLRSLNLFLRVLIAFVMTPIIIHSLGDRMYGFWILIGTFIGYYGLFDIGLSSSVQRFVSRALGQNDMNEMNSIINTTFFMFLIIGIVTIICSLGAAIFSTYFIKSPEEISLFRKVIIILGFSVALGFPIKVFQGVLTSYLRYDLTAYVSMIQAISSSFIIYYFLKQGYGIWALTVISFFANLVEYILTVIYAKRVFPELKINYHLFSKERVKLLFGYSSKTFIAQLGDILRFRVDSIVIAGYLSVSLVTYYSVGAKIIEFFGNFIMGSIGLMSPVFSQYEGRSDYDAIRSRFLQVTKISVVASIFIGMSIIFYGKVFIQRWMGSGFESSYTVVVILCIPYIIALMQNPSISLLYGISKHHFYAISNTIEAVLNLTLSIILVKYFGIYGVALGTAIGMIIFKLLIQPVFVCRAIKLSLSEYYINTLGYTALKMLVPLMIYFYVVKDYLLPDYPIIILSGVAQMIVFIPIVFFFVMGKSERNHIRRAVRIT